MLGFGPWGEVALSCRLSGGAVRAVPVPRLEQRGRPGGALAMIGIAAAVPISASRSAYGRAALERIGRNRATYSFSGGILVNPPAATDPPILMR